MTPFEAGTLVATNCFATTVPKPHPHEDLLAKHDLTKATVGSLHVFVDNSNITAGVTVLEGDIRDTTLALDVRQLVPIVEAGRVVESREVVGSRCDVALDAPQPPPSEVVWTMWKELGYKTRIARRDTFETREVFVDEALHSAMTGRLFEPRYANNPQTMALLTGDGNDNEGTNSFPRIAEEAALRGWRVEIWSWLNALSRNFRTLAARYPRNVIIVPLDDFREKITYVPRSRTRGEGGRRHASAVLAFDRCGSWRWSR